MRRMISRNRDILLAVFMAVFLLSALSGAAAQDSPDRWTIRLVTVGRGYELYYWFGHNGLIVEDNATGRGVFYDYGTFSFDQPGFYRNFVSGRLMYRLSVTPAVPALNYIKSINRAIRFQTLNLSPEREQRIVDFLTENAKPENRVYLYHHYLDNCATRVRDVLDMALDGQLRQATSVPGRMTYRQHTRRYLHQSFPADWFLMFIMGMNIDKPITVWNEMFLPFEMERVVAGFSYRDVDGTMVPLAGEQTVWYESYGHTPPLDEWKPHWPITLIIGLIMAGLVYGGRFLGVKKPGFCAGAFVLAGVAFLLIGLLGTALALIAAFTDHSLTYYNMNLFFANPVTLVLAVACVLRVISCSRIRRQAAASAGRGRKQERLIRILAGMLLAAGLLSIILKIFPAFRQQNWLSLCGILPIYAALLLPIKISQPVHQGS